MTVEPPQQFAEPDAARIETFPQHPFLKGVGRNAKPFTTCFTECFGFSRHAQIKSIFGVVVCIIAFIGMTKWKLGIIPVVLGAGVLGVIPEAVLLTS